MQYYTHVFNKCIQHIRTSYAAAQTSQQVIPPPTHLYGCQKTRKLILEIISFGNNKF